MPLCILGGRIHAEKGPNNQKRAATIFKRRVMNPHGSISLLADQMVNLLSSYKWQSKLRSICPYDERQRRVSCCVDDVIVAMLRIIYLRLWYRRVVDGYEEVD